MGDKKFPKLKIISNDDTPTSVHTKVFLDDVDISKFLRAIDLRIAAGEVTRAKLTMIVPCDVIDLPINIIDGNLSKD